MATSGDFTLAIDKRGAGRPAAVRATLRVMSLDYAAGHLRHALVSLGTSEAPMQERLQHAWDTHVQMVWMKRCLTRDLLREFKQLWEEYTAPSDDPRSTDLRALAKEEFAAAVTALAELTTRTAVAASQGGDEQLATLADLE